MIVAHYTCTRAVQNTDANADKDDTWSPCLWLVGVQNGVVNLEGSLTSYKAKHICTLQSSNGVPCLPVAQGGCIIKESGEN